MLQILIPMWNSNSPRRWSVATWGQIWPLALLTRWRLASQECCTCPVGCSGVSSRAALLLNLKRQKNIQFEKKNITLIQMKRKVSRALISIVLIDVKKPTHSHTYVKALAPHQSWSVFCFFVSSVLKDDQLYAEKSCRIQCFHTNIHIMKKVSVKALKLIVSFGHNRVNKTRYTAHLFWR